MWTYCITFNSELSHKTKWLSWEIFGRPLWKYFFFIFSQCGINAFEILVLRVQVHPSLPCLQQYTLKKNYIDPLMNDIEQIAFGSEYRGNCSKLFEDILALLSQTYSKLNTRNFLKISIRTHRIVDYKSNQQNSGHRESWMWNETQTINWQILEFLYKYLSVLRAKP